VSTRDLRVRFVGDASGLKSSFGEVNAAAAGVTSGLGKADVSANTVGRSFTRTSKLFRGAGKAMKGSGLDALSASSSFLSVIPAVSGVASGLGLATIAADGLTSTFSSLGLAAAPIPALLAAGAVAAIGAGVAYAFLHDDTSAATDALRDMEEESAKVTAAQRESALAVVAGREALRGLTTAQLSQEGATIALIEANRNLAAAQREYGRNSLEVRSAVLSQKQAEEALAAARRTTIRSGQEVIANVERRKKATEDETAAVKKAKVEADKWALGLRLGLVNGKDLEAAKKAIAKASDLEAGASSKSAARHRANATEARKAAAALKGDTTPAVQDLRRKLIELAGTELDMSNAIAAMNNLSAAAGGAAGAVQHVYNLLRNPPVASNFRVPGISRSNEVRGPNFMLRAATAGSPTDLARTSAAGSVAANAARRAQGERGYMNSRLQTINALLAKIETRRRALVSRVANLTKKRAGIKVPSPGKKGRKEAVEGRAKVTQAIEDARDELETLFHDDADLRDEAAQLGSDLGALDRSDEAAAAEAAADARRSALDAASAEAALTPGIDDDLAAAAAVEAAAESDLNAARASGDNARIAAAASALLQARQNIEQLKATRDNTDALNANTAAVSGFGGSSTFSYRGQDYTLRSLAPPSSDRLVEATI
jgi:hypothetical protein